MSVRPAHRLLLALLGGVALLATPPLSAPSSATPAPIAVASMTAAPAGASTARSARPTGAYRITVRGWTRTIQRGNQSTIDHCRAATLWEGPLPGGSGTTWLAGHDHCGFYRWDRRLHVGDRFTVTTPSGGLLRYRVTGHGYVGRHSGSAAGLIRGDITLQTCRGSGTAFTYARLISR
jgi:hypothetical protein